MKKVALKVDGLKKNVLSWMRAFYTQAKKEQWTNTEIATVFFKATSGDSAHFFATLAKHCQNDGQ